MDIGVRDSARQVGGFGKTPGVSTFCSKKSFPSCRPSRPCRETLQVCDPWTAEPSRQKTPVQTMGNSLWHHDTRQKLMRFCLAPFPSKIRWWEGGATSDAKWDFPLLPIHTPIYSHLSFFFPPFLTPPLPPVEFLCSHETIAQRCDSSFSVRVAQLVVSALISTLTSHASLSHISLKHTCHHNVRSTRVTLVSLYTTTTTHPFLYPSAHLTLPSLFQGTQDSLSSLSLLLPFPPSLSLLIFPPSDFPALPSTLRDSPSSPPWLPGYFRGTLPRVPGRPSFSGSPAPRRAQSSGTSRLSVFFLFMICVTLVVRLFVQGVLLFFRVFFRRLVYFLFLFFCCDFSLQSNFGSFLFFLRGGIWKLPAITTRQSISFHGPGARNDSLFSRSRKSPGMATFSRLQKLLEQHLFQIV